jgi:hypothetical protein
VPTASGTSRTARTGTSGFGWWCTHKASGLCPSGLCTPPPRAFCRRNPTAQSHPTLEQLDDQIAWYDRKSLANQRWYKGLKVGTFIAGAIIPFAAGVGAPAWLTGGLGGLIVVLEGLQASTSISTTGSRIARPAKS